MYIFSARMCTYMEVCPSVAHPSHHDIRVHHPTVGRNTEAHPSRRTDVHCKCDRAIHVAESPVEHVRISIPLVEGGTEGVPTGEVTQNEGQQSQQTQQRPHCGNRSPSRMKSLGVSLIYTFCAPAPRSLPASHTPLRFEWPHSNEPILPRTPCYRSLVPMLFPYKTRLVKW